MLNFTFQDITHEEDLTTDLNYGQQMLAKDIETCSIEKRYLHKDTSIVWIYLTVSLVWKDKSEPDYFIAVVEDITKRSNSSNKKADQSFMKKEENGKLF